jgi:hypothetical protein
MNFLRFLTIFGEKIGGFHTKNFCIIYLRFESKTPIFWLNFSAKMFLKDHDIGPGSANFEVGTKNRFRDRCYDF